MTEQEERAIDAISSIYKIPPQPTLLGAFHLMFKRSVDPFTGRLGPPYLNPIFRAGIERQGHDADAYAATMEATFREQGIWPED